MNSLLEILGFKKFTSFIETKENKTFDQPHVISADPPMKLSNSIMRLAEAFKKSKEVTLGKEVDSKSGGEKPVTMKSKKLFIVGGAVRDHLLGHTPRNFNFVTDAHPDEVEKICRQVRPSIDVVKKDNKNGIVKISIDGESYEIETMKGAGGEFTSDPKQDAERRDVTVNALYYEPSTKKIYDFTGGLRHIKDGNVKFIGKPEDRIKEDGMRKYRYARMVNKIPNAKIDDSIKDAIGNVDTEDLSPEKIRDEFWQGLEDLHCDVVKYLTTYDKLGLLQTVFPKLDLTLDFPNCKTCKSRPIVLASLLKNNKPEKLVSQLRELKYTDREIKDAVFLINLLLFKPEYAADFKREMLTTNLTKRQMLDWCKINDLDSETIEKLINFKFSVNPSEIMTKENLFGDQLRDRIRSIETEFFMKM